MFGSYVRNLAFNGILQCTNFDVRNKDWTACGFAGGRVFTPLGLDRMFRKFCVNNKKWHVSS